MVELPTTTVTRSDLRKPEVVASAYEHAVEILGGAESLTILPTRALRSNRQVRELELQVMSVFVELRRPDPSPAVLGEAAFVADWPREQQENFLVGCIEALAESLRTDDPTALRTYIDIMGSEPPADLDRPDLVGDLSGSSPEDRERLEARLRS